MKNTMKTQAKNEVFESLAHYLFIRHAYTNEDDALIDCYTNSSEVIDTLIYNVNGIRIMFLLYTTELQIVTSHS